MVQMMQPGMWAHGVPEPDYAQGLIRLMQPPAMPKPRPGQGPKQPGQPLSLAPPGAGNGNSPMQAMASTANMVPMASALMQMFGGRGFVPDGVGTPHIPGPPLNPFGTGSAGAIY